MKLSGIRQQVFLDRYSLKDEKGNPREATPEQMWKRVAKGVAQIEEENSRKYWEKKFYQAMEDFKFVPGGRILSGAGTRYKVTFFNCFVLPSPKDSREGILETLKQMVEIMARGGGVGINLSSLRPRGARVKKVNGFSSGPCNWAELFSVATKDIIQQGGTRRGALILMLWDWHPDIEEFITVKRDLTRINGANLSVAISDRFMEAVKKDSDWQLVFPDLNDGEYDEKWTGDLEEWIKLGKKVKVYKNLKARKIWDLIAEAAWASAEPGVVFMERYNKGYNNWYFNKVNCVNPCVTGDTLVATEDGWIKARELKVGQKILTPKGFKPIKKFYHNGRQRIYEVYFSDGGYLKATPDHKLRVVRDGFYEWLKVIDLEKGDRVLKLFLPRTMEQGWESQQNQGNKKKKYYNHQQQISIKTGSVYYHNFAFLAKNKLNNQNTTETTVHNITLMKSILSTPLNIGGKTAMANNTWPIPAVISDNFLSSERVSTGLSMDNRVPLFFTNSIILEKESFQPESQLVDVVKVQDTRTYAEVFDVYEPETMTWITNGYLSLDCGEEGLPPWGVCNLASINLAALVKNGKMDYRKLVEIAKVAVHFQDDVIDADAYVFPQIREVQQNGERRIGLGTMGLGDALIKMRLRYGSQESLKIIEKIYSTIRDAAYESSVEIAKEKGPFPKFEAEKYLEGAFLKRLPKKTKEGIRKWGIRNSLLLQQAPTGSTSLLAGVSSGIEPVYEFSFLRRDRLGEHKLYHPLFAEWEKAHPKEPVPDYFVSANDLTPEEHVKVQAAIQKYVDASISKTVNAPKTHTVADVKKLYTQAFELGCKGITYMREGSRPGVLERVAGRKKEEGGKPKAEGEKTEIKERPMMVAGATYQIETPVGTAFVTINTGPNNEPLEVFINVGKAGSDVTAMAEALGRIASLVLRQQSSVLPKERAKQIFNQLIGIGGSKSLGFGEKKVRSLPDAVAKVLAMHFGFKLKNGNGPLTPSPVSPFPVATQPPLLVANSDFDLCPSCGEASLAYEEGCKKCYSCGYSEC